MIKNYYVEITQLQATFYFELLLSDFSEKRNLREWVTVERYVDETRVSANISRELEYNICSEEEKMRNEMKHIFAKY